MNIEAKLGLDVFKINPQPHIIIQHEICREVCQLRYCLHICPAELYTVDAQDEIQVNYEGCLECGACFIACTNEALIWEYPQAGFGVQYRFG